MDFKTNQPQFGENKETYHHHELKPLFSQPAGKSSAPGVVVDVDDLKLRSPEDNGACERDGDVDDSVDDKSEARETWGRSLEFLLSLLGYAVGLGNLWRFPYLCMRNGGGAFLFPFLICLLTCGLPLFFLEVSLGQFLGKSSLHAWTLFPLFKGLGVGMIIINIVFVLYYNMIMAWTLYYLGNSFNAVLPWSTCTGWWNTPDCIIKGSLGNTTDGNVTYEMGNMTTPGTPGSTLLPETVALVNASLSARVSAEEEFWTHNVLQLSSGLGDFGGMPWHLAVCLFGAWIIVFLCIMKGVKSIGKVIYATALLPYVLLTVLLIRGLTLDGAMDGIVYYLKPDLGKMMRAQVWVEAALQVFFSLGPGWGPIISMASYNKFNNNCLRDALIISFVGEGTSIFSGFVVFTILGYIAHEFRLPIEEVVKSGPGLAFVAYPQALARMPVSQLWAGLFFFMLLLVGLDSQFSSVESVIAGITDLFPRLRKRRLLLSLLACMLGFLIGLPFCMQGGMYLFQLVDWYVAIFAIPVFGFIECCVLGWIYGAERFSGDLELMLGRGLPVFMRICWCFITPAVLVICLVFTLMTYTPPNYGSYRYPLAGQIFGWLVAAAPLIPLPVAAVHELLKHRDMPLRKRLLDSVKPSKQWKPNSPEHQKTYTYRRRSLAGLSLKQRITVNILGDRN